MTNRSLLVGPASREGSLHIPERVVEDGHHALPLFSRQPVRLGGREVGQVTEPLLPTLTPDGAQHPIFANIAGVLDLAAIEAIGASSSDVIADSVSAAM